MGYSLHSYLFHYYVVIYILIPCTYRVAHVFYLLLLHMARGHFSYDANLEGRGGEQDNRHGHHAAQKMMDVP